MRASRLRLFRGTALTAVTVITLASPASAATRSATTLLPGSPGSQASATARCPHGLLATGGGFETTPFTGIQGAIARKSAKSGQRAWTVVAEQPAGSGASAVRAIVYCSRVAHKTKTVTTTTTVPAFQPLIADVGCGRKGNVQAGGFFIPLTTGSTVPLLTDSFRLSKKTWRSGHLASPSPVTVTSFGYCAKRKAPSVRAGSIVATIPGTTYTASSKDCTRGTRPVGGGFSSPDSDGNTAFLWQGSSKRVHQHWQVSARLSGLVNPRTLTAYAYCG